MKKTLCFLMLFTSITTNLCAQSNRKSDKSFEVPENTITRYRNANIDIEKINGTNGKWLPVPAVYIIDKESTVTYRFFESDYKKRPSVAEILKNL